ncbi:hypothetical protein DFH08DRAFT_487868 [Mycena albidolilacea]|uniref:Uncharacterized protein n=1 Tax=Mycena albidolilacea TaxID=1033008 RepID=A0AAD6Z5Q7_9AGAR|nr:hypothetical protein DFH08DRAFT_487868 [Mycena albidolilacea]
MLQTPPLPRYRPHPLRLGETRAKPLQLRQSWGSLRRAACSASARCLSPFLPSPRRCQDGHSLRLAGFVRSCLEAIPATHVPLPPADKVGRDGQRVSCAAGAACSPRAPLACCDREGFAGRRERSAGRTDREKQCERADAAPHTLRPCVARLAWSVDGCGVVIARRRCTAPPRPLVVCSGKRKRKSKVGETER